jgi:ABC-type glycerol-3-phosphate transport system substrate-binding protein
MKATKHPKEAYLLSAFLSSADSQRELLHQDSIPARKSVMAEVLPNTPASNWKVFEESVELAKPVESPADYAGVSEIFDRYMSSVLSNQMDAATAMQKAKAEIDSLLAKSQYK